MVTCILNSIVSPERATVRGLLCISVFMSISVLSFAQYAPQEGHISSVPHTRSSQYNTWSAEYNQLLWQTQPKYTRNTTTCDLLHRIAQHGFTWKKHLLAQIKLDGPLSLISQNQCEKIPALYRCPTVSTYQKTLQVKPGDTLSSLLQHEKISANVIHKLLRSSQGKKLECIMPGEYLELQWKNEQLSTLYYHVSPVKRIVFHRRDDFSHFESSEVTVTPTIRLVKKIILIDHSLFVSGKRAGLDTGLLIKLKFIFNTQFDLTRDVRKGDSFSVLYEEYCIDGKCFQVGCIVAACFINQGTINEVVRYIDPHGNVGYYSLDGNNIQPSFERIPLKFKRISSGFSHHRKHPIYGTIKPHLAVDFVAPMNTPISVTGNGIVKFMGEKRGYGKVIIVKHPYNITTLYAHLNSYHQTLYRGCKVKRGDVIGFLGMTGAATGPHLHYEFKINGIHQDPLAVALPKHDSIATSERLKFNQLTRPLLAQLRGLSEKAVAMASKLNNVTPET